MTLTPSSRGTPHIEGVFLRNLDILSPGDIGYETVKRIHGEVNVAELLAKERDNEQAGIKLLIEEVTARATEEVQSRWGNGPLKGVDLWSESHCRAMLLY